MNSRTSAGRDDVAAGWLASLIPCLLATLMVVGIALLAGCASSSTRSSANAPATGVASYYADKYHGRTTASGERFDMNDLTAAHRTLAFGTRVRVTNRANGRSVVVRINDRGPFVKGRVIDLSLAAARKLDMVDAGLAEVELQPLNGTRADAVARTD
jgi:rare lipoprotein A